ncbi:TPA: PAAR domain-containing protein [Vibrio parahaemolyticus]|uniref:PAAR domain-containing protein n=1 Tax=Vibrio owensii TaxID=696485 RepID=UPI0022DDC5F1|nr:PAAR domain-containing protein [Vibrio owensii]MDA0385895.1 PAAR domain-containing protein [Vibrio owensii]
MKFVTKGTGTTTGGVVLEGHNDVIVEGKPATSIHQYGSCASGRKSCKGKGIIVPVGNGNKVYLPNGQQAALSGYQILCNCPDNFILESNNAVNVGANVSFGSGVSMTSASSALSSNAPSNHSLNSQQLSTSNASTASQAATPQIDPKNAYWPPYNPLAPEGKKELKVIYEQPIKDYAWLSVEEAEEFAQNLYEDLGGKSTLGDIKNYGLGLGKGSYDAYMVAKGLGGLKVQSYTKTINGQDWIIIKNYRKHLKTLERGHKWKANNSRIIKMSLGLNDLKGATRYVRFNVGLEFAVSIGINALDYALRDEATMTEFVGNSAVDMVKGFISLGGAALLTAAFVPVTIGVLATGIFFTVTSFYIGKGLDHIDNEYGYSEDFVKEAEKYFE